MTVPLACPVRGCGLPLQRVDRRYACVRGHSHDVARSGYVNLLQPQDRRSRDAGDSAEIVRARAAILDAGVGRAQHRAVAELATRILGPEPQPVVVDLGSGTGDLLIALGGLRPLRGVGIDLSAAACEHAARRSKAIVWVVANADRRLPILDGSVDAVLSVHGRRNPEECHRVLKPHGHLIVALPAADDLMELREAVHGRGLERARQDDLVAGHAARFAVRGRSTVRERLTLSGETLRLILRATYRGGRISAAAHVAALETLDVTVASDIVVLQRQTATR